MSSGGALPDLSTILSRVTENPQAMSMLSSLLGGVGGTEKPQKEQGAEPAKETVADAKESVPAISAIRPRGSRRGEDKRRLLLALKPFLSPGRQSALDTLLLVLEATSLLSFGKEPPCT